MFISRDEAIKISEIKLAIHNEIYQYNLTIYYNQLSTNSQLPKIKVSFEFT